MAGKRKKMRGRLGRRNREERREGEFCSATAIDKSDRSNGCVGISAG